MALKEGDSAPDFRLKGVDGKEYSLKDFKGKTVILYFYPKDDTPGCTIEAKEFTKHKEAIEAQDAVVMGVSADDYESHCNFRDKYKLNVLLLSDPESKIIKEYGAYGDKGIFGMGIIRSTFVIDGKGKISKIYRRVQALGHAEAVLKQLKNIGGGK